LIRKTLWLLPLAIVILLFHSCESQPDVPLVVAEVVPTTTTTTVRTPVMVVSQAPTTTTTTLAPAPKPILPSISEPEYRNLFASVNNSYKEAIFYELEGLLPEGFVVASAQFQDARANFETQVWRWPYNGEAAYPFAQDLRAVGRNLDALLAKGLPLRSEAEKAKVQSLADTAKAEDLAQATYGRNAKALDEFELGKTLHTKAQYRASIAAFRKAKLLYASATALAAAEAQKTRLEESGFAKYSPYDIIEAERLIAEDESLYELGNDDSVARGTELLHRARQYYANAYSWGLECDAAEARDKALLAKRRADSLAARDNAAEEYELASSFLEQGDENRGASEFSRAAGQFRQAEASFENTYRSAAQDQCEARAAQELAKRGVEYLRAAYAAAELEPDPSFMEAELFVGLADLALDDYSFALATFDYLEALTQLEISQAALQSAIEDRQAAAQAEAERRAAEKAAAEQAATQDLAAKNAELEALRAEKAEAERRLAEALAGQGSDAQAEAKRLSAERAALEKAAANAKAEADRLAAERAAAEQAAAVAAQAAAEAKAESERLAAERAAAEQAARDKASASAAARERAAAEAAAQTLAETAADLAAREATRLAAEAEAAVQAKAAADADAAAKAQNAAARAAAQASAETAAQEAARAAALTALTQAQARYDWATEANAENNYPDAYAAGAAHLSQASQAYEAADYQEALAQAQAALAAMAGIAEFAPFPAGYIVDLLPERKNIDSLTFIAAQSYVYNDPLKWGILYQTNKALLKDPGNPDLLLSGQTILIPSLRGENRSGVWDPKKTYGVFDKGFTTDEEKQAAEAAQKAGLEAKAASRANAQTALDKGQNAYDKALARNAKNNYSAALAAAVKTLDSAKASFKTGDFAAAATQAQNAQEAFAAIPEFAPLPARYKVRYIPGETDTLWRIAGFPFIYNNNYLWMRLYNANKDLLHAPNDPHLILPGQILSIPSLKGEKREGLWDAKKTYPIYK
jgi:hypothetical protein